MKECLICGASVEAVANTRYCKACADKVAKARMSEYYRKNKGYLIPGQSERLSEDVHNAIALGISYGVYIGRAKPKKEEHKNAYRPKRIFRV